MAQWKFRQIWVFFFDIFGNVFFGDVFFKGKYREAIFVLILKPFKNIRFGNENNKLKATTAHFLIIIFF